MTNFTKGPWVWLGEPGRSILNAAERKVIDYAGYEGMWPSAYDIHIDEANMRLIAAAPDLFEALKGVIRVADRSTVEFDAARAAIAKALGTEQCCQ